MPILKIPNVSVPGGGDVYSVSISQGYNEAPSTIDVSVLNGAGCSTGLGFPHVIQIGSLLFKGYCISREIEQKVGERVVHLKFCDKSVILDQIQVGLIQRHYGLPEPNGVRTTTGKVQCPTCEGDLQTRMQSFTKKVRIGNFKMGDVFIMGNEEPQHSQCDFPDVNYTFGDLYQLMKAEMSIVSLGGVEINSSYRNKFVGSLREVLSNWCAEFGYSFYWDFSRDQLVIYNLNNGISIGDAYERIKNDASIYVKSYKEKTDLSSTISHGVAVMKQMPNTTYESQPIRNFAGIYYSHVSVSCGGNFNAGAVAKTFGNDARKVYLLQNGYWERFGFDSYTPVSFSEDSKVAGPCNERYGIPTICDAIKSNAYNFYYGVYNEAKAARYEELDICEAENYGRYFKGPFLQLNAKIKGDALSALNQGTSVGTCVNNKKEFVENKLEPAPENITLPGGNVIQGITLTQDWQAGSFNVAEIFAYKVEGQSVETLGNQWRGRTLFGIPKDYYYAKNRFSCGSSLGTQNNNLGTIIQDTGFIQNQIPEGCSKCNADAQGTACGQLKCDTTLWSRSIGWFGGNSSYPTVKVGGVELRGPTIGSYVGFLEQSSSHTTSTDPVESYSLEAPPSSRNVMNTELTLVDANNDNALNLPYVPPPYSDTKGREEKIIEVVGLLPAEIQSQLNPSNGVESYQINYGSEGIRTIITFGSKGRKFPKSANVLSSTISSRGNYTIPKLSISQL